MAENKKSFIAYSDWYGMLKACPDDVAGKLIKHIFAYVNDENPSTDDFIINALFEQIKATLKRDLVKWEEQREQRSNAGKKSAELRLTKSNERSTVVNETERKATVSVSVSVNDINKILLSEIEISDVEASLQKFTQIAKVFQETFITNLKEKGAATITQEKATFKNYVNPIRLMIENKECTIDDLRDVESYLSSPRGEFWKSNILSTATLRKQITKLVMEARKTETIKPKKEDRL